MADEFEDRGVVVPGAEALGRGIVDKSGRPSGSPANWEATRGKTSELPEPTEDEIRETAAKIVVDLS